MALDLKSNNSCRSVYNYSNMRVPKDAYRKLQDKQLITGAWQCFLLMSISVLADCHGFDKEEIGEFFEEMKEITDSCEYGQDDWRKINEAISEEFDIRVVDANAKE